MKPYTVVARVPLGYNDFGRCALSSKGIETFDQRIADALPDDLGWYGDEIIGPIDCDFGQDDFDDILSRAGEWMLANSDEDDWEDF